MNAAAILFRRSLTLFFALYFLALTLKPCADHEVLVYGDTHAAVFMKDTSAGHNHTDCCSPLCTCNCCSLPLLMVTPFSVIMNAPRPEVVKIHPVIQPESVFSHSIWEPPKA